MTEATAGAGASTPPAAGGTFAFSSGTPTFDAFTFKGTTGIKGELPITNGDSPIPANALFAYITAEGLDGQTESVANNGFWSDGFAPSEHRAISLAVQVDPGRWNVVMGLQDASGASFGESDPQVVKVAGAEHHAHSFTDQAFDYTIEIARISAAGALITVEYLIHNTGAASIPAGFPISIAYAEPDGAGSNQFYAIEVPVHPGQPGHKKLHLEGANTHSAGDTAQLWLTGDEGGVSEKTFQFNLNWESADSATALPA
jgi:hypothetical protein